MMVPPLFLVAVLVALTGMGAMAFRQFVVEGGVGWLIVGLVAYNASNIAWIGLIDRTGLGLASAYAAASQIVLVTFVSMLLGDPVGRWGWVAAALACLAVVVAAQAGRPTVDEGADASAPFRSFASDRSNGVPNARALPSHSTNAENSQ